MDSPNSNQKKSGITIITYQFKKSFNKDGVVRDRHFRLKTHGILCAV